MGAGSQTSPQEEQLVVLATEPAFQPSSNLPDNEKI